MSCGVMQNPSSYSNFSWGGLAMLQLFSCILAPYALPVAHTLRFFIFPPPRES
jgi:hypothetical protein